ncbi:hypothetical protein GCM10009859_04780 [Kocuria salsicia]
MSDAANPEHLSAEAAAPAGRRTFTLGAVGSRSAGGSVAQPPQQVGDAREAAEAASSDSFYAQVGGHETFVKLTHEFYARVAEDPDFKALYPEEDLGPAEERLRLFLEQYWGGPTTYSEQRGHPRLRMRHAPFPVDTWARETWLAHMRAAMDAVQLSPLHDGIMWDYFERAAHAMVNRPG